jgi:hypothetical protein
VFAGPPFPTGGFTKIPAAGFPVNDAQIAMGVGEMRTCPLISPSGGITIKSLTIKIDVAASAGGTMRLGLYTDSAGLPGTLVADFGTVVTTSTGLVTLGSLTQPAAAGLTHLVMACQGQGCSPQLAQGTPLGSTATAAGGSANPYMSGVTGALPGTFTVSSMLGEGAQMWVGT